MECIIEHRNFLKIPSLKPAVVLRLYNKLSCRIILVLIPWFIYAKVLFVN